jgi:hypothetical protein
MIIATPEAEARVLGTSFALRVDDKTTAIEVSEGIVRFRQISDGRTVDVPAGYHALTGKNAFSPKPLPATGRLLREYWTNYTGNFLQEALVDPTIASHPDGFDYLPKFESEPLRRGLRFGERLRGYVQPPKTGLYRFVLSAVHVETRLLLSRSEKPEEVVQGAHRSERGGDDLNDVTPVPLEAGRMYYIEVAHESDGGNDHLTVIWQAPSGDPEIIPGKFLSPYPAKPKKGKP